MKILLLILLGVGVLIAGPFATIWSLNTLFGLGIGFTIQTWLAVVWLSTVTFGGLINSVNNLKK